MTKITEVSTFRQHKKKTGGEGIDTLSIKIWYNNQKNRHNENGRYPWILLGGGAAQVLRIITFKMQVPNIHEHITKDEKQINLSFQKMTKEVLHSQISLSYLLLLAGLRESHSFAQPSLSLWRPSSSACLGLGKPHWAAQLVVK